MFQMIKVFRIQYYTLIRIIINFLNGESGRNEISQWRNIIKFRKNINKSEKLKDITK